MMRLAIASDHAGFDLKIQAHKWLLDAGHEINDLGPASRERLDYPDKAHELAGAILNQKASRGILICGSGIGMAIAANRHVGIRAANCVNVFQSRYARLHNDINVLCLGERIVGPAMARDIISTFLSTKFEGGRHQQRVHKIDP